MLSLYKNKLIKLIYAQLKVCIIRLHEFLNLRVSLRLIVAVNEKHDDSRAFVCRWQFGVEKNNKSWKKRRRERKHGDRRAE